ncbi:MAG: DUF2797 domain-containing protein [Candidatus Micrarchaeota archaeon]|nr:DUF2797 domain-containing protein [Candidatus Micrarchaeota archaeon]
MKHVLNYSCAEEVPTLFIREKNEVYSLELKGKLVLNFSEEFLCVGYKDDKELYRPCPLGQINTSQCPLCKKKDVANVYTVGDFSYYPNLKEVLAKEKYVLYLAQFGEDITKLGLTRRSRYLKRWKEQGADFASVIAEFEGPEIVYEFENYLQQRFNFNNSVRSIQKLARLNFDKEKAFLKIKEAKERLNADFSIKTFLVDEDIYDLSSFYPKIFNPTLSSNLSIEGEILGAKGQWLFFKNIEKVYAFNLSKVVGKLLLDF